MCFATACRSTDSATLENSDATGELTLHDGTSFKGFSFGAETSMVRVHAALPAAHCSFAIKTLRTAVDARVPLSHVDTVCVMRGKHMLQTHTSLLTITTLALEAALCCSALSFVSNCQYLHYELHCTLHNALCIHAGW
jgi:hypothetical protein